ncbi:MBL fold metallo-hydrolase [Neisseria sp. Ec49-e6-T10]|uniref:MBL fold metallo-hydrolase n=1 Tax=Neisseria sp. Ec49-e6-T10 TaxID=3140744 RepID=UPI003EB6D9A9
MAKITTFEIGYCTHMGCIVQKGAGFRVCKFPSRAWLLEVGENRWLWDTGYANYFNLYTQSGLFALYRKVTPVYLNEGESLLAQLVNHGVDLASIKGVILSHFHADHIAGLKDFSNTPFICCGNGWQKIRHLRGIAALKQAFIPELIPADFEQRLSYMEQFTQCALPEELAPFDTGYILPDSKDQIILVSLPGHAVGHIGAFVLTDDGWVLIASDAAWSTANYQALKKPSKLTHFIMDSSVDYHQTLSRLNQLYLNKHVDIRLSHEGDL